MEMKSVVSRHAEICFRVDPNMFTCHSAYPWLNPAFWERPLVIAYYINFGAINLWNYLRIGLF